MDNEADVIVIGAGLAGMSAAFALSRRGRKVLVLEEQPHIGGRTASWVQDGMPVESGLHKFLGIYRALPRLLRACGVDPDDILVWTDALEMHAGGGGRKAYFDAAPYHRPLRTLRGILGNNQFIPPRDKLRIALFGLKALAASIARPTWLDERDVSTLARASGISERVIHDVLHTATSAVLFLPPERFSGYAMFSPIREGIKRGMTFRIGAFAGGMTDVMMEPIARALRANGGEIRNSTPVRGILLEGGRAAGVETDAGVIRAHGIVLATSLRPAQHLIASALPDHPWFAPMLSLETLSAVTLQCELDAPLFAADHTHFSDTAMACFAEQSHTTFRGVPGRLSAIMFPPGPLLDTPAESILDTADDAAERMGFDIKTHVTRYRVIRHPHDFYAMHPGSEARRPAQRTPVPGLALAGDYTRQPFGASMEGAVLSGMHAATALA